MKVTSAAFCRRKREVLMFLELPKGHFRTLIIRYVLPGTSGLSTIAIYFVVKLTNTKLDFFYEIINKFFSTLILSNFFF